MATISMWLAGKDQSASSVGWGQFLLWPAVGRRHGTLHLEPFKSS